VHLNKKLKPETKNLTNHSHTKHIVEVADAHIHYPKKREGSI